MSKLEEARKKINQVDKTMANLFELRMQAVEDVIQYKKEHNLPVLDTSREEAIIKLNKQYIQQDAYKDSYEQFMHEMMAISRRYQASMINAVQVGYQGVEGAFSYIASNALFPDHTKKKFLTFEDVFQAVEANEIAYGVLPFENSYTGEVGEVLDLLLKYDVCIGRIYDMRIDQHLLGLKGATLEDIKQVYSKDEAIHQSKQFLEERGYEVIPYPNTALAAAYVAVTNDKTKGAIAAKESAELYNLDILAHAINTSAQNTTRFIVIEKEHKIQGNQFSLAFLVHHKAGALAQAMNVIAKHGCNMLNIKSRSIKDRPWEYYFYVEMEGNVQEEEAKGVLEELANVCEKVKVLGVYTIESRDE